jgi:hypothetical protein
MMIGADFLMSHRMMIDVEERKIVFTYLGGKVFQTVHVDATAAAAPAIREPQPH